MNNGSGLTILKRCIATIIEKYTSNEVDENKMKEIKHIVRGNCELIPEFVSMLFHSVQREDCEGRIAILRICNHLFQRSHAFRVEITDTFKEWLLYTVETDPLHHPLPPPKTVADALKTETIKIVKEWHRKFASAYPKLFSACNYLRSLKAFDFDRVDAQLQAERLREEELNRKKECKAALVVEEVNAKFLERKDDIKVCVNEVRNALKLLMPRFDEEQEDEQWDLPGPSSSHSAHNALHAYSCSDAISIVVPLNTQMIEINESNKPVVQSLMDSVKMLRFYCGLMSKWLSKLTKDGGTASAAILKKILDLKSEVCIELQRYDELKLPECPKKRLSNSGSESDDFEDVPEKEGLELDFRYESDTLKSYEIERIKQLEAKSNCDSKKQFEKTTLEPDLLEKKSTVPMLSFGLDLKYWGEETITPAEVPRNNSDCHRFWRPSDEIFLYFFSDTTAADGIEAYKSRLITFVGKEVTYNQCRAPLSDGKLCPRHDKYRCPVHGPIIPRDDMGFPIKELKNFTPVREQETKDDGDYMRDLESAMNVELRAPEVSSSKHNKLTKRSRKRRVIGEAQEVRDRLSAKLFNPRSLKRVTETLDAIQKANAAKRFGQQFNYALS